MKRKTKELVNNIQDPYYIHNRYVTNKEINEELNKIYKRPKVLNLVKEIGVNYEKRNKKE